MDKRQKQEEKDKKLLKQYLNQYYISKAKRLQLEKRLKNIREEMNTPIGGLGYSPVNYGGTNQVGLGAASFVYRMSEIETRIGEQKTRVENALLKVMDIMDFLEEDSKERMILELRFIDIESWDTIAHKMYLSRSSCFNYQNKALKKLLSYKKVRMILDKYKDTY